MLTIRVFCPAQLCTSTTKRGMCALGVLFNAQPVLTPTHVCHASSDLISLMANVQVVAGLLALPSPMRIQQQICVY
jgi:hypothetical protein